MRFINFAKQFTSISQKDIDIILHARKSLLFGNGKVWNKKFGDPEFDVTMGSFDGAEICELVGLYILSVLSKKFEKVKNSSKKLRFCKFALTAFIFVNIMQTEFKYSQNGVDLVYAHM